MRDILISLIIFGAIPLILRKPYVGIYVWCWISYMNPHRMAFGFAYNMPFAAITAAAVLVGFVFSKEPKKIPWTPVTVIWLLFVAWMCITTFFAMLPAEANEALTRVIKIQMMTLVTLLLISNRKQIHWLVWVIAISIGFFGIKGGVFTILTGGSYRVWGPPNSFIEGNNELALALIIVLPLMRYMQLQLKNKWGRIGLTAAMVLTFVSVLASYSRGALLAAIVMGFMFFLKSQRKLVIGIMMAIVISGALTFLPDQWFNRMDTIQNYEEDTSAMGRINAWWFAFNVAKDRPLVGGGYNVFYSAALYELYAPNPEDKHDAHSIYFEVLGEHGFIGLILFLVLWFLTFRTGTRIIRDTGGEPDLQWARDLAAMVQVSIVGYAVGGAFLGMAYFDLPYHLMAILVLTRRCVETQNIKRNDGAEKGSVGNII